MISDFGGMEVFLCLGINGASKEFKQSFLPNYIKNNTLFKEIHVFDGNFNYGKPRIINLMTKKYDVFDYIVSMDSDMTCIDSKWLKKFLYTFDLYNGKKQLGVLCANQTGNNVHFVESLKDRIKVKVYDGLNITYSEKNEGVGGGVLITNRLNWNSIGGYRAFNIYGSDDGHFALDCLRAGKIFACLDDVVFFHPFDDDKKYSEWKVSAARNVLKGNLNGYYENMRDANGNSKI
jgi:hypothetical protein